MDRPHTSDPAGEGHNFAYVTVLTTDNYLPGVLALHESLLRVGAKYPLFTLCSRELGEATRDALRRSSMELIDIDDNIAVEDDIHDRNISSNQSHWSNTFNKLLTFGLCRFDKITYLDSDMIVVRNIDNLFEKPHMSAVAAGASHPGNEGWVDLNSGLMVIEPSPDLLPMLVATIPRTARRRKDAAIGDQDVLHDAYPEWSQDPQLRLHERYNLFTPYLDYYIKHLGYRWKGPQGISVLHYIGPKKPWMLGTSAKLKFAAAMLIRGQWHECAAMLIHAMMLRRASRRIAGRPETVRL